jgi:hypothetical protein
LPNRIPFASHVRGGGNPYPMKHIIA